MTMSRELWYKLLGKDDALDRSLFYRINEIEDSTKYELDLGKGNIFLFSKKTKKVLIGNPNKQFTTLSLAELKKMFNFAKKNGAI